MKRFTVEFRRKPFIVFYDIKSLRDYLQKFYPNCSES